MILARATHERTPRLIWEYELGERRNCGYVQNDGGTCPSEDQLPLESHMRYKGVKCFDVRPNQNNNVSEHTLCRSGDNHDINLEPHNDGEKMEVDEDGYFQSDMSETDNDLGHSGTVEELWIAGERQVEWRRAGKTIKTFSGERIALQALWTNFVDTCTSNKSYLDCIVIREKERLRIYSDGGREFLVALPFDISGVWNTKYGLLLERSAGNSTNSSTNATKPPSLMSLHHPLDDLTRIIVKTRREGNVVFCEWNSNRHKIVFTSANPSICVTFDTTTCYHNIWLIRQTCSTDDVYQTLQSEDNINENDTLNQDQEMEENYQITPPLKYLPYQPPNLTSSLLNSTRFKQFHNQLISSKQNTPSSGLPSVVGSPSTLLSQSSPICRPTPNISANSCVAHQKSQNSSIQHNSLSGFTGTSTRKHTPVASGANATSSVFPDSPAIFHPQLVQHVVASLSTREFMSQHGTPIRASNPAKSSSHKQSHCHLQQHGHGHSNGTPMTRFMSPYSEVQQQVGLQGGHITNTGTCTAQTTNITDGANRLTSTREFDFCGTDQPLPPEVTLCLDHIWSEEHAKVKIHEISKKGKDNKLMASKQADKVFLSKDLIGKKYICFLHKNCGVICILPYQQSANSACSSEIPTTITFGNLSQIGSGQNQQGRFIIDAAPIDSLGMILTVEKNENGLEVNEEVGADPRVSTNISLYTGGEENVKGQLTVARKVADVHIEPIYNSIMKRGNFGRRSTVSQLSNIAHEISILHLDNQKEKLQSKTLVANGSKNSSTIKNSMKLDQSDLDKKEMVTSSRPPSASADFPQFNDSCLSMLSPVARSDPNFLTASTTCRPHSKLQTSQHATNIPMVRNSENSQSHEMSRVDYGALGYAKLFHNGLRLQITLPPISTSSLVRRCLQALYAYLPYNVSLGLAIRWYRKRNAPGPSSISFAEEWKLFARCLLDQMGYRTDQLESDIFCSSATCKNGNDTSLSPVYPKKMRPDEAGSDEDWQKLLDTRSHAESGQKLSFLIGIPDVSKIVKPLIETTKSKEENTKGLLGEKPFEQATIDSNAHLFEHLGSILWSLHLLYEDLKLNRASIAYLSSIAMFLSKLAGDLRLIYFVEHYWRDFPLNCPKTIESAQTGQMLPEFLPVIGRPFIDTNNANFGVINRRPPCIYSHVTQLIDNSGENGSHIDRFYILPDNATKRSRDLVIIYAILSSQLKKAHRGCKSDKDIKVKLSDYLIVSSHSTPQESKGTDHPGYVKISKKTIAKGHDGIDVASSIVRFIVDNGYNAWELVNSFPVVLALPILAAMFECRLNPRLRDSTWAKEVYKLIGRPDLANRCIQSMSQKPGINQGDNILSNSQRNGSNYSQSFCAVLGNIESRGGLSAVDGTNNTIYDGLDSVESEITRLRWPKDRRLADVRRMLQSARPVIIAVEQRPEMSDHDFLEVQERALQAMCVRTMALPIGRGALSFRTIEPLPTEISNVPKLNLSGRAPPRGATVEMDHIDVVPNMERWPSFHNGVAAGLRISQVTGSGVSYVDSNWITFNKPKESSANPNELVEHGGFLMALGLNGHLASLGKLESFDYLIRGNDMISIGILLGTCAAKRGSMDILTTKKIATQVEALLPSTATELPLSHTTQVAGLAGLGLLYQGTGHRQMAEVCLGELGRPPGPEMENCTDRESYSLSAGLALGMITLGQGDVLNKGPLSDLHLPETLYHHMVGGPRSPSVYRHRFRSPSSYQIQEGDTINIDITSPGATLALGLMFFNSGNKAIANWMNAPDSQFLLEFVRPDFLMVRTLAKGLIMWEDIVPHSTWIDSHVPTSIRPYCLRRPGDEISRRNSNDSSRMLRGAVDYETINQAYCNIIAGASLAMALRFAGSNNGQAFEVLHNITHRLLAISKRSVAELAGKATIEQTICVLVLSLAIVAAGSGDLEVIRIIRFLRSRVGPKNPTVTYGSHMALHMALGLLFLGGGRYTLSTSPEAVAAMVAAFFPKFPTHSNDNRYHLQALRHLYVLAAEPRLLVPRDIHSGRLVFCHIELELADTPWYKGCSFIQRAPTFLPELKYLKKVSVKDPRYHQIVFKVFSNDAASNIFRLAGEKSSEENDGNNFAQLEALFKHGSGILDIQQKAGSLSYQDDPQGFRSLTGQCLTKDASFQWSLSLNSSRLLSTFSTDPAVGTFTNVFIKQLPSYFQHFNWNLVKTSSIEQIMGSILYECASQEKLDMLPFYLQIFQNLWEIGKPDQLHLGHQMKILVKLTAQDHIDCCGERGLVHRLVNPEIVTSVFQGLQYKLDLFLNHHGVETANKFLITGKFDSDTCGRRKHTVQRELRKEQDFEGHILNMEACNLNAFANLLVLHQMMLGDCLQDKIATDFKAQLINFDKTVNPLEMLLKNKGSPKNKRQQNNL